MHPFAIAHPQDMSDIDLCCAAAILSIGTDAARETEIVDYVQRVVAYLSKDDLRDRSVADVVQCVLAKGRVCGKRLFIKVDESKTGGRRWTLSTSHSRKRTGGRKGAHGNGSSGASATTARSGGAAGGGDIGTNDSGRRSGGMDGDDADGEDGATGEGKGTSRNGGGGHGAAGSHGRSGDGGDGSGRASKSRSGRGRTGGQGRDRRDGTSQREGGRRSGNAAEARGIDPKVLNRSDIHLQAALKRQPSTLEALPISVADTILRSGVCRDALLVALFHSACRHTPRAAKLRAEVIAAMGLSDHQVVLAEAMLVLTPDGFSSLTRSVGQFQAIAAALNSSSAHGAGSGGGGSSSSAGGHGSGAGGEAGGSGGDAASDGGSGSSSGATTSSHGTTSGSFSERGIRQVLRKRTDIFQEVRTGGSGSVWCLSRGFMEVINGGHAV